MSIASTMKRSATKSFPRLVRFSSDVRRIVEDWKPMLGRVRDVIADLKANPPPIPVDEIAEAIQFLEWLTANNFTLLGIRDYQLTGDETDYEPHAEGGLGLLRDRNFHVLRRGNDLARSRRRSWSSCASRKCSSSRRPMFAREFIGASISTISGSSATRRMAV